MRNSNSGAADARGDHLPGLFFRDRGGKHDQGGEAAGLVVQEIVRVNPRRQPSITASITFRRATGSWSATWVGVPSMPRSSRWTGAPSGCSPPPGRLELGVTTGLRIFWTWVAERLAEDVGEDPRGDAATEQTLYDACERAKRALSPRPTRRGPCAYQGRSVQVAVTRADFEKMTEWRIQQMLVWTRRRWPRQRHR